MERFISIYQKEFDLRKGYDLTFNRKNDKQIKPRSIKLFRIDGDIPVSIWSEFVSQFLLEILKFMNTLRGIIRAM